MQVERVTIAQVAAEAGVSAMTVSNVINSRPGASEATRQRVLEVIDRLGYRANGAARALRSGLTGRIGIVSLDLTSEYSHEIVRGIAEVFAEDERELLMHVSVDAIRERERIEFLANGVVDGLLLIAPLLEEETEQLLRRLDIPAVVIDPRRLDLALPRVTVDNYSGVRAAAERLIELGHRRIAFIRGEEDLESSAERFRGFTDALRLGGLEHDPSLTPTSSLSYAGGRRVATDLLNQEIPTAVMTGADVIALGVIDAAREYGLEVPQDLSVIGFDDIPRALQTYPALTTVRQPLDEMGRAGARAVLSLIDRTPLAIEDFRLPTRFIERGTVSEPRPL